MGDTEHTGGSFSGASEREAERNVTERNVAERGEAERDVTERNVAERGTAEYDVAIVGASLAGCASAILLARAGARVVLIEKRPDAAAFKRICTHYIQSAAIPTLERLGLLEAMEDAGALRSRVRAWTRWGWIMPPADSRVPSGINLRRERLDPLIRGVAAATPGVELLLGWTARELLHDQDCVCGVVVGDTRGGSTRLRARLVVGADGRDSRIAELAAVRSRTYPHGRFAYGGYFEGPSPAGAPDGSAWFMDPQWAAAFPTDSGLTFYACMPTMDRLPEFRGDPAAGLTAFMGALPDAPPILASRLVEPVLGKIDMPNMMRGPIGPGLALVGDAALATDPLFGVGCGWALQSAEWLADSVAPALRGEEPSLQRGLVRYRRRYTRALRGHAFMIHNAATGRRMKASERLLFSAAARDPRVAASFEAFASCNIGPARMLATGVPRALAGGTRQAIAQRVSARSGRAEQHGFTSVSSEHSGQGVDRHG